MGKQKVAKDVAANPTNLLDVEQILEAIKKNKSYKGTQQNLYTYSSLAWDFYGGQLVPFGLYSPAYTATTGTDAKAFITATEAMPSFELLRSGYVVARKALEDVLAVTLNGWQMLKGYCKKAYGPETLATMLTAAGAGYYTSASNFSWDDAATLIRMANTFMTDHVTDLTANDNMPPTFPASFQLQGEAFTAQRLVFKGKEETARLGILAKFDANEQIYKDLVAMTDGGKVIFRNQPTVRRNFIINNLYKEARGNSPSGVKGIAHVELAPEQPVANARIFDQADPSRFAITDEEGKYELNLPADTYTLIIEATGFESQSIVKKITIGTKSRLNFKMVPVPVAVEEAESLVPPTDGESKLLKAAVKEMGNGVGKLAKTD